MSLAVIPWSMASAGLVNYLSFSTKKHGKMPQCVVTAQVFVLDLFTYIRGIGVNLFRLLTYPLIFRGAHFVPNLPPPLYSEVKIF